MLNEGVSFLMTKHEINNAIAKWRKYALVGNPSEPDYGSEKPRGVRAASLERNYRSPQIWHAPEPDLVATLADYELVEPVYQRQAEKELLRLWYFEPRTEEKPSRATRDAIATFGEGVARAVERYLFGRYVFGAKK